METVSTTRSDEIDQNKYAGHVSSTLRLLTSKDGYIFPSIDKIDETRDAIKISSINIKLIDNHEQVADSGKVKSLLPLEFFWIL